MTKLESRLNDQLQVELARTQVEMRNMEKHRLLRHLRSVGAAMTVVAAGFDESEETTQADEIRFRTLEPLEHLLEDLAVQAAAAVEKHKEAVEALIEAQRAAGTAACPDCGTEVGED